MRIFKVAAGNQIGDAGAVAEKQFQLVERCVSSVAGIKTHFVAVAVTGKTEGMRGKETWVVLAGIAYRSAGVSPHQEGFYAFAGLGIAVIGFGIESGKEFIPSGIEGNIEPLFIGDAVAQLGIEVVEIVVEHIFTASWQDQIKDGTAEGKGVSSAFTFADGAVKGKAESNGRNAEIAFLFAGIAFLHRNIEHRAETASVAGWESTLIQLNAVDGIGIENREKAEHVLHIVQGHAVEQDQVLIGSAAAHIQAGRSFVTAFHAGQQLDGFDHVDFTEQGRKLAYLLDRQVDGAHLVAVGEARSRTGADGHLIHIGQRSQPDAEAGIGE